MTMGWAAPLARDCIEAVGEVWGVAPDNIRSDDRRQAWAEPRMVAYFLARTVSNQTYPQIARAFGRDHSTVIHGCQLTFWRVLFERGYAPKVRDCVELAWRAVEARHAAVMARDASSNRWLAVDLRQSQPLEALA